PSVPRRKNARWPSARKPTTKHWPCAPMRNSERLPSGWSVPKRKTGNCAACWLLRAIAWTVCWRACPTRTPMRAKKKRSNCLMERLDVTILGRDYTLACNPDERDALVSAAQHVDRTMHKLRSQSKAGTSTERIAIIAALQLAGELMSTPVASGDGRGVASGDYKREIKDMQPT